MCTFDQNFDHFPHVLLVQFSSDFFLGLVELFESLIDQVLRNLILQANCWSSLLIRVLENSKVVEARLLNTAKKSLEILFRLTRETDDD